MVGVGEGREGRRMRREEREGRWREEGRKEGRKEGKGACFFCWLKLECLLGFLVS